MIGADHSWTISRAIDFSLPNLLQYDAIFLAGDAADNQVLIDYVNAGGNVYLAGGTGFGGAAAEAARWATFLNAFGFRFELIYNGLTGVAPIASGHPIFDAVSGLYQFNGSSIIELDPLNPDTAILVSQDMQGLFGIFSLDPLATVAARLQLLGMTLVDAQPFPTIPQMELGVTTQVPPSAPFQKQGHTAVRALIPELLGPSIYAWFPPSSNARRNAQITEEPKWIRSPE
jgi:hypothetical protein